jgi:hypothetical protein
MVGADLALATHMLADAYTDDKTQDELEEAIKDAIVAYAMAFIDPLLNKTFAKGIKETTQVITEPDRRDLNKFTHKQISKFYPRYMDMLNAASNRDEIRREVHSVSDTLWKRLDPSKLEPSRHAVYGTIQYNEPRSLGLFNYSKAVDPIMTHMMYLGINIRPLEDKMEINGETKKLTPKQYSDLGKELEKIPVKGMLQEVIDQKGYDDLDDATKKMLLQEIVSGTREMAKANFLATEDGTKIFSDLIDQMKVTEASISGVRKIPSEYGRFYTFLREEEIIE